MHVYVQCLEAEGEAVPQGQVGSQHREWGQYSMCTHRLAFHGFVVSI